MKNRKNQALKNHKGGYNCAQAVALAFQDVVGMDEKDLFKATEALGFGMGTMDTCGAVSAMAIITGLLESDGNLDDPKTKRDSYKAIKEMINKFKEKNTSIVCKELKGVETGEVLRSCDGCIEDAVEILEDYVKSK